MRGHFNYIPLDETSFSYWNSNEVCYSRSDSQQYWLNSELAFNRRQAIIGTNVGLVYWRIYASPGGRFNNA